MNHLPRTIVILVALLVISIGSNAQLLIENFEMTASQPLSGQGGWSTNSSANNIVVSSGSLSFDNYASSGIGNMVSISSAASAQSVSLQIGSSLNSGSLYISFLIRVTSVTSITQDYILSMRGGATGTTLRPRFYLKRGSTSGKVQFGVSKDGTSGTSFLSDLNVNDTYLVVLKYTFNSGSTSDDQVYLYLNPSLSGSEPLSPDASISVGSDISPISEINLRQPTTSGISVDIDGIRVATSWSEAPLPVQLVSFTAYAVRLTSYLRWSTATETNNYGFEIERREIGRMFTDSHRSSFRHGARYQTDRNQSQHSASGWTTIGFVAGAGTSTTPREYTFTDHLATPGRYAYRIKQIDSDGTFEYFYATEVEVGLAERQLTLFEPYPNPYSAVGGSASGGNPSITIDFTLPDDGPAQLKLYDVLGREIQILFDREALGGRLYRARLNSGELPSGLYILQLRAGNEMRTRKLILTK